MKRRLAFWMILLFAPTLILLSIWMSEYSFETAMRREQERVQMTEAFIAPQVQNAISTLKYEGVVQAARQYRRVYAAQGIELIFCYHRIPLGDATLPNRNYDSLLTGARTAMLDTVSDPERYVIAEPLTNEVIMLLLSDVSAIYDMRTELQRKFILASLLGSALMALLSWIVASRFTHPIEKLTSAAKALAEGKETRALPVRRSDELGTLARSFEEMRHAVNSREEALREEAANRQSMLDALAHEMRTPLCSLLGNARYLQMPVSDEERCEVADDMAREIKRLSDMDAQLMKLTQLRNEEPEWAEVALLPLLKETAQRVQVQANEIKISVEGRNSVIIADRELLAMLADNLTVNAIRASQAGQTVVLTAHHNGFSVKDEGCGMTQEQLDHIFEPFFKADKARTRACGGAGLGLTVCKQIVELHKGQLRFHSQPGRGTQVDFTTSLQAVADFVTHLDVPCDQEVSHP